MRNRKTREIANDKQKGQKRNLTYRALIQKYKAALKDCYYLEAITLMESLIADRMTSKLVAKGYLSKTANYITLGECIRTSREYSAFSPDLIQELEVWWGKRNEALHEMAKIANEETESFDEKYLKWKAPSEQGYILFGLVKKEERKKIDSE